MLFSSGQSLQEILMTKRSLWAAALALAAAACVCSPSLNLPVGTALPDTKPTPGDLTSKATAGPSPTPLPTTTAEEAGEDEAIYEALLATPRPAMDRVELAIALKGV